MVIIGLVLALGCSIVNIICAIIVIIKIFQNEDVVKGIFAIICGLYALILGWQNKDNWGIGTVMTIWLISIVGGIIGNVLLNVAAAGG